MLLDHREQDSRHRLKASLPGLPLGTQLLPQAPLQGHHSHEAPGVWQAPPPSPPRPPAGAWHRRNRWTGLDGRLLLSVGASLHRPRTLILTTNPSPQTTLLPLPLPLLPPPPPPPCIPCNDPAHPKGRPTASAAARTSILVQNALARSMDTIMIQCMRYTYCLCVHCVERWPPRPPDAPHPLCAQTCVRICRRD